MAYLQATTTANSGFYTFASLPLASENAGSTMYTVDQGPVWSDGSNWNAIASGIQPVGADPNGTADSTAALQTWATRGSGTSGVPTYLPPGNYKTLDTIVFSGLGLICQGSGATRSKINLQTAGIPGIRLNIGDSVGTPCGYLADLGVIGPAANPTDFKAGILWDSTKGFNTVRTDVGNFDIGYDFINNCFNSSLYNPSCHRFASCNVGIYLRGFDGAFQAGNDISIYDPILSNKLGAVVVGPGGGYHFFGGQFGTSGLAANRDDLAAIMLGVVYDTVLQTGIGSLTTGGCTADFTGLSIEGVNRAWFIQMYDEITAGFYNIGFTPSVAGANAALGILKMQNAKNSQIDFGGCLSIQAGGVLQTAVASFSGGGTGLLVREGPWNQGAITVNGSGLGTKVMLSLAQQSTTPSVGIGSGRRSSLPFQMLGQMWLRGSTSTGGVLQFAVDNTGTTWNPV